MAIPDNILVELRDGPLDGERRYVYYSLAKTTLLVCDDSTPGEQPVKNYVYGKCDPILFTPEGIEVWRCRGLYS